jgi:hypothetical protein
MSVAKDAEESSEQIVANSEVALKATVAMGDTSPERQRALKDSPDLKATC